jgi:YesN/AraC family two-component response regulator
MNTTLRNEYMNDNYDIHVYFGKGFHGHVPSHSHSFYHFILVLTGAITQQQNQETHHLLPGDLFSTPPNTEHNLFIFDYNTTYYCLSATSSIIERIFPSSTLELLRFLSATPKFSLELRVHGILEAILELLLDYNTSKTDSDLSAKFTLLESFIKLFMKCSRNEESEKRIAELDSNQLAIKKCIKYIEKNFASIQTVDELVEYSGLSKSMLYRLFSKETNRTIHQYLTEIRIQSAAKMIQLTNLNLTEISQKIGYSEFSTFYRNFLKITNLTPSEYQKTIASFGKERALQVL